VIVFKGPLVGLEEQHRRITLHLPDWVRVLSVDGYDHRVWEQRRRGYLRRL